MLSEKVDMDASILTGEKKPEKKHKLIEIKPANKGKLHKKLGAPKPREIGRH